MGRDPWSLALPLPVVSSHFPGRAHGRLDVQNRYGCSSRDSSRDGGPRGTTACRVRRLDVCAGVLSLCFLLERGFHPSGPRSLCLDPSVHPQLADQSCTPAFGHDSRPIMHLFINSLAASAGGGLTYIRNVLPRFAQRSDVRVTVVLGTELRRECSVLQNVQLVERE